MNKKKIICPIESITEFKNMGVFDTRSDSNRARLNGASVHSEVTAFGTTVYKVTFFYDDHEIHHVRYKSLEKAHEVARLWVVPEIMDKAH